LRNAQEIAPKAAPTAAPSKVVLVPSSILVAQPDKLKNKGVKIINLRIFILAMIL
jgi:hypothetical protein